MSLASPGARKRWPPRSRSYASDDACHITARRARSTGRRCHASSARPLVLARCAVLTPAKAADEVRMGCLRVLRPVVNPGRRVQRAVYPYRPTRRRWEPFTELPYCWVVDRRVASSPSASSSSTNLRGCRSQRRFQHSPISVAPPRVVAQLACRSASAWLIEEECAALAPVSQARHAGADE